MVNGMYLKLPRKKCQKSVSTKICSPKDDHPWVTRSIKSLMRKCNKLYAKYKIDKSSKILKSKFYQLRHKIQRKIRESCNTYLKSILTDQPENVEKTRKPNRQFWTFNKQQKSDSKEITSLKSNGTTYTKPADKANILNNQFHTVFTSLVPLKLRHIAELLLSRSVLSPSMPDITISIRGVSKQLSRLNPGKTAEPDS